MAATASAGIGGTRLSQATSANIGASPVRFTSTLPMAQLSAPPIARASPSTPSSALTVNPIRTNPTSATAIPAPDRRHVAEEDGCQADREKRLHLLGHRRDAGWQSIGEREKQQQELPGEQRQADQDQQAPRNSRARQQQRRQARDQKPERGQLRR